MQEQISIVSMTKLVDVFKRALEYLKVEYEVKEIFHSKWRKNKGYISFMVQE